MPVEIKTKNEFQQLAEKAVEVRIVRKGDAVKLKLRTRKALYTFKATNEEVESLTKGLKVDLLEF